MACNIKVSVGNPNPSAIDGQIYWKYGVSDNDKDYFYKDMQTQTISFLYFGNREDSGDIQDVPNKISSYDEIKNEYVENGIIMAMNYSVQYGDQPNFWQFGIASQQENDYSTAVSVYKKEIWYNVSDGSIIPMEEQAYHIVNEQSYGSLIYDYNVGNNRYYKYLYKVIYSQSNGNYSDNFIEYIVPVSIDWQGWSLTELRPVKNQKNQYSASLRDVWCFKYNMQAESQQQNISKTKQDTLSKYPKFVHGPQNSVSGSVSCLLGSDVTPAVYSDKEYVYEYDSSSGKWQWTPKQANRIVQNGGYQEKPWDDVYYHDRTSNPKIDMLKQFMDFCYSGNPKLLKDSVGNRYIVQVTDPSYTINDTWNTRPISIEFSWSQIGAADDVKITEET